jgi:hypothetical protein
LSFFKIPFGVCISSFFLYEVSNKKPFNLELKIIHPLCSHLFSKLSQRFKKNISTTNISLSSWFQDKIGGVSINKQGGLEGEIFIVAALDVVGV